MNNKYKVLLKDTFIFFLGKFGSRLVLFFLVPLYTNYLSKPEYGTSDLVFTSSQLLVAVFSITIYDSVVRFGLAKDAKKENVLLNAFSVLGFCCFLCVITIPLVSLYKSLTPWKYYLAIMILLAAIMDVEMNYLKVINRNLSYSIISIVQSIILAGSNILFLVVFSWGIQGYLLSTILSYLSCVLLAFFAGNVYRDLRKAHFDRQLLKQMLLFSAPLIINNVSWWVIQQSDKFMIEAIIGASALGLYTAASKIPSLINVVVTVFQQSWGISSIREIESTKSTDFYSEVFKVFSAGVFACCIVLNSISKPFMSIYVGKEFVEAWRYVPLLVASAGFSAVSAFYGSLYSALKKSINSMMTTVCSALVNIIINYILIQICGVWGAIIGTIVSYVLIAYLRLFDVSRYIKMTYNKPLFILNSLIVVIQAMLVSLDFYPYFVSLLLFVLFVLLNRKILLALVKNLKFKRIKK